MLTIHPATTDRIAKSASPADPIVLCAADENYVKPLTVMLHSAAASLNPGRQLNVVLFDGGMSESSLNGIRESLIDFPVTIDILRPDLSQVSDLMTSHHITHTAYLRLMAARLLPDSIEKVIYLDSDLLVLDDALIGHRQRTVLGLLEQFDHSVTAIQARLCGRVEIRSKLSKRF